MAKNTIRVADKKGKTISEFFGVSDKAFHHASIKMAAALTASVIRPNDKRTKGDVALDVMKELAKDKDGFKVKDMNSAFVFGMAFALGLRMKQDLVESLEKKVEEIVKPSGPDIVTRMAEQDFAEISKGIAAVGERIQVLARQKVIN